MLGNEGCGRKGSLRITITTTKCQVKRNNNYEIERKSTASQSKLCEMAEHVLRTQTQDLRRNTHAMSEHRSEDLLRKLAPAAQQQAVPGLAPP